MSDRFVEIVIRCWDRVVFDFCGLEMVFGVLLRELDEDGSLELMY